MGFLNLRVAAACLLLFSITYSQSAVAQPEVDIVFEGQFGQFGSAPGEFNQPTAVAVDSQNRIIVAERLNNRYQICNHQGECERFGFFGSMPGQFLDPQGVTVDSQDRIIIAESNEGNSRVQTCNDQGDCSVFRNLPANGIATDSTDRILFASTTHNGVYICSAASPCSFIGGLGTGFGQFNFPRDVAVDNQDRIFVADWNNQRIQICNDTGICSAFGRGGAAVGQFNNPSGVAVDQMGRIIVADRDNHRIQVCDDQGACVAFGEFGTGPGQFQRPLGVAVDNENRIIVSERDGNRIQIFRLDGPGFKLNPGLNGSWANFDTLGQGFFIDVLPDIPLIFFAWFTYDTTQPEQALSLNNDRSMKQLATAQVGDENHRWLTAQGSYDLDSNSAILDVTLTTGGLFDDPAPVTNSPPGSQGTITLTFKDCKTGTVDYDLTAAGLSGSVPIQRLAEDNVPLCESFAEK
jgi:DNA-binding beta-propeller fold protein YncE